LIPISRKEKDIISSALPSVHITIANKEHVARDKSYYMEPDKRALRLIACSNIMARKELLWRLEEEVKNCWDKKRKSKLIDEIKELKNSL